MSDSNKCQCKTQCGSQCSRNASGGSRFCTQHKNCANVIGSQPVVKSPVVVKLPVAVKSPIRSKPTNPVHLMDIRPNIVVYATGYTGKIVPTEKRGNLLLYELLEKVGEEFEDDPKMRYICSYDDLHGNGLYMLSESSLDGYVRHDDYEQTMPLDSRAAIARKLIPILMDNDMLSTGMVAFRVEQATLGFILNDAPKMLEELNYCKFMGPSNLDNMKYLVSGEFRILYLAYNTESG